jgi:hypothetical protein
LRSSGTDGHQKAPWSPANLPHGFRLFVESQTRPQTGHAAANKICRRSTASATLTISLALHSTQRGVIDCAQQGIMSAEPPSRRIGLSPLNGRYLIVGTSFYYSSAGRDGVAAIWAPKSRVGHRRITRNSRALAQRRGSLLEAGIARTSSLNFCDRRSSVLCFVVPLK